LVKDALCIIFRNHWQYLKEGLLGIIELAEHAYEEGKKIGWNEKRILETESNSRRTMHRVLKLHIIQMRI
jgi:hypothetical protein